MMGLQSPGLRGLIVAVVALCGLKLWLSTGIDLLGDEAFYFLESRHLAAGYSDVPPLTAWTIALGTFIAGPTQIGVRWPFIVLGSLVPLLVVALARHRFNDQTALKAGWFSLLLPLGLSLGVLALPDVLLCVLWLSAACLFLDALADGGRGRWLALGLVLALGMMTHLRFVLLPAGLLLLLATSGSLRYQLTTAGPWLAGAMAAGGAAVVALLQPQASAAALKFQLLDRHPWQFDPFGLTFALRDALVVTPLVFALLLWSTRRLLDRQRRHPFDLTLLWCGAWPVLVYWVLAPWADQQRSQFHWTLAGWLTLCAAVPLALSALRDALKPMRYRAVLALTVTMGLMPGLLLPGYVYWLGRVPQWAPPSADLLPDNLLGWSQVAKRVDQLRDGRPVIADNFMLAAQLSFALDQPVPSLNHPLNERHGRADQLRHWRLDEQSPLVRNPGRALLVVEETALDLAHRPGWLLSLCQHFPSLGLLEELTLYDRRKRFLIFATGAAQECDQPAFWYLDGPIEGQRVGNEFEVHGWAFENNRGVAAVDIYRGDQRLARATYGLARPGVAGFFPGSRDPQLPAVGFTARIDSSQWPPGVHQIAIRVIETDGAARWSRPVQVVRSNEPTS